MHYKNTFRLRAERIQVIHVSHFLVKVVSIIIYLALHFSFSELQQEYSPCKTFRLAR